MRHRILYSALWDISILIALATLHPAIAQDVAEQDKRNECIKENISKHRKGGSNAVSIFNASGKWIIAHCYGLSIFVHEPITVTVSQSNNSFEGNADIGSGIAADFRGEYKIHGNGFLELDYEYHFGGKSLGNGSCQGMVLNNDSLFWQCSKDERAKYWLEEYPRFFWTRASK